MTKQKMACVDPVASAKSARLAVARMMCWMKEGMYGQIAKKRGRDPKVKK